MTTNVNLISNFTKAAQVVAAEYAALPNVVSVVIGGSLARDYTDASSDIEMYVYYEHDMPSKDQIQQILSRLQAPLTRSKNVHWFHPAWGYHTFFGYNGIKFELGYRDIHETYVRMREFASELILPKHGIHDTPFGHYESGVASCISECKILVDKHGQIKELKRILSDYHNSQIRAETYDYYIKDAKIILAVKAGPAAKRDDEYNFHACVARAIRSIIIALFAVNDTYYPGDKWNGRYIEKFTHKPKSFEPRIKAIMNGANHSVEDKKRTIQDLTELANEVSQLYKPADA